MEQKKVIGAMVAGVAIVVSGATQAVPIEYSDADQGAASFAEMTNSQTAAASFDTATGPLSIIDFESGLPVGVTIDGGVTTNVVGIGLPSRGSNTTVGGVSYMQPANNFGKFTFNFTTAISAFGAYLTGLQGNEPSVGQQTITYQDGSAETVNIPKLSGGGAFVGFTDIGASIYRVEIDVFADQVGIDDVRYGTPSSSIPEPGILALFSLGIAGIGHQRRRRLTA